MQSRDVRFHLHRTASGNVTSMCKPLDRSLWFHWIMTQEANQMAGVLKNYHHLRYLLSLCGVQKGQSFCAICGKGPTASKSQGHVQFRAVSGNISDIVYFFWFAHRHVKDRRGSL